jgi:hypothetical protein
MYNNKFLISEVERERILNLHKHLINEQRPDRSGYYQSLKGTNYGETEGEISHNMFKDLGIGELSSEVKSQSSVGCRPETNPDIINQDFKLEYPNDRNYRYLKIGEEWYAKNIKNNKVFNLTKCGYTETINKLNSQFNSNED